MKRARKEKEVVVITRRNTKETGEQYFTEELSTNTENLIVGFNSKTKITILDQEGLPKEVTTKKLPKEAYQKATATSEETVKQQQGIAKAFDEDNNTFWHANWENGKLAENPDGISVEIPLDAVKELAKLTYLPRLEPEDAGTIGQYVIEAAVVKEDGKTAEAVAEETEAAVVEETEAATETALPAEGDETESKAAVAADAKTAAEETIQWKKVCEGTFKKQGSSKNPQESSIPGDGKDKSHSSYSEENGWRRTSNSCGNCASRKDRTGSVYDYSKSRRTRQHSTGNRSIRC